MAEAQIDPALLDEGGSGPKGRGVKRKAQGRTSGESATAVPARTSSRLATGRGGAIGVGVGVGVGVGAGSAAAGTRQKGKGKEVHEEEEPSRGEEENLIGSEYKLRGKRPRASRSPVKKRAATAKSKQSAATTRMDGLAAAAEVSSQPMPIVPPRPPYPIGRRPFLYPCIRPDLPHRPPPGDPSRPFKRFDPHEFDDPKSLEVDDDGLSSDDEDYTLQTPHQQAPPPASSSSQATHEVTAANLADLQDVLGDSLGTELDYDTQAYQSLAALLEASHDEGLFGTALGGTGAEEGA